MIPDKPNPKPQPSIFEELEIFIPTDVLPTYHRYLAYVQKLPPDDELMHLLQAMGILTLLTRQVPAELIAERKELKKYLSEVQSDIGHSIILNKMEMVSAENAIKSSAKELSQAVATVTESARTVRKGFIEAGEQVDAERISKAVANRLELQLIQPAQRAVEDMAATLGKLPKAVEAAKESVCFLRNLHERWYWTNIFMTIAMLVFGCSLLIGMVLYNIYCEKINAQIAHVNEQAIINAETFKQLNSMGRAVYLESDGSKWRVYMMDAKEVWMTDKNVGVIEFRSNR